MLIIIIIIITIIIILIICLYDLLQASKIYIWDCAFSRSIWPRDAVSCPVECFRVSPNSPLSGDSRTHLKIVIFIISLNHWLLLLSLLSSAIIIFSKLFNLKNCLLHLKTPIMFLYRFHKVFTICYIYKPFCRRVPTLYLSVLNRTPTTF